MMTDIFGKIFGTLLSKIIGSAGSKRAVALLAAFIVSMIIAFSEDIGFDFTPEQQALLTNKIIGLISVVLTLLIGIWSDTKRPLDPRVPGTNKPVPPKDW
tara:strand:+ start:356 stop:655 length:300 start_codon:yes stop_codon:yes gene_type:complete